MGLQRSCSTPIISLFYTISLACICTPHLTSVIITFIFSVPVSCACSGQSSDILTTYTKANYIKKLDERKGKYVLPCITLLPIKSNKLVLIIRNFLFLLLFLDLFIGTICLQFASINYYQFAVNFKIFPRDLIVFPFEKRMLAQ